VVAELISAIDGWAADNNSPSRSDTIRALIELGLSVGKAPAKAKR